ncbi:hypothetical protein ERJ75_000397800 [Trypanosoma vivax]|nr:hypothetical protein ERJ75_000397800 [Trypanosoma vivax]
MFGTRKTPINITKTRLNTTLPAVRSSAVVEDVETRCLGRTQLGRAARMCEVCLCNCSMQTKMARAKWQRGIMAAPPKPCDEQATMKAHWPDTLATGVGKMMGRMVTLIVTGFIEDALRKRQTGMSPSQSTSDAHKEVRSAALKRMGGANSKPELIGSVRAFDSVDQRYDLKRVDAIDAEKHVLCRIAAWLQD